MCIRDSLCTTYLRELKKVQASEITGSGSSEIYVPTLWYYNHLNFLSEVQKVPRAGADSLDPPGQSFPEDDEEERQEEDCQQPGEDVST